MALYFDKHIEHINIHCGPNKSLYCFKATSRVRSLYLPQGFRIYTCPNATVKQTCALLVGTTWRMVRRIFPPECAIAKPRFLCHVFRHLQGRSIRSNEITFIAQSRIFIQFILTCIFRREGTSINRQITNMKFQKIPLSEPCWQTDGR